jgi:hypothetical protein
MTLAHRMQWILILVLTLAATPGLAAQQEPLAAEVPAAAEPTSEPAAGPAAAAEETEAALRGHDVRDRLTRLLLDHPSDLGAVLGLDPGLLENAEFLAAYPELERFVAEHPEVRRNPHFYLEPFRQRERGQSGFEEAFEALAIFGVFALIALALGWFIRTVVEQRRWSRLAQTQSEVHNKILDRFDSREQLLAYVQSPAGAHFLQSAPIPVQAERRQERSPASRALWPVQAGVVLLAVAVGMLVLSGQFDGESAQGFFALGVVALSLGLGFLGSAAVSIWLSRRLGLWEGPAAAGTAPAAFDDPDAMG